MAEGVYACVYLFVCMYVCLCVFIDLRLEFHKDANNGRGCVCLCVYVSHGVYTPWQRVCMLVCMLGVCVFFF